jgi:hypothetical protein
MQAHWTSSLKKSHVQHLMEMNITTLEGFKRCRSQQLEMMGRDPPGVNREACWDCWEIARKLGLEGKNAKP